jgi:hypothetical protein
MPAQATAPNGFETRGLLLGGTEVLSGGSGLTDSFKPITFDKTLWKAALKDKDAIFLRFKCSQIVSLSGDGTNGVSTFEVDKWHRVPIGAGGYIKAAAAANLEYILEIGS